MQALDYDRSTTGEKSWATMAEGEGEEGSPPQKEHLVATSAAADVPSRSSFEPAIPRQQPRY